MAQLEERLENTAVAKRRAEDQLAEAHNARGVDMQREGEMQEAMNSLRAQLARESKRAKDSEALVRQREGQLRQCSAEADRLEAALSALRGEHGAAELAGRTAAVEVADLQDRVAALQAAVENGARARDEAVSQLEEVRGREADLGEDLETEREWRENAQREKELVEQRHTALREKFKKLSRDMEREVRARDEAQQLGKDLQARVGDYQQQAEQKQKQVRSSDNGRKREHMRLNQCLAELASVKDELLNSNTSLRTASRALENEAGGRAAAEASLAEMTEHARELDQRCQFLEAAMDTAGKRKIEESLASADAVRPVGQPHDEKMPYRDFTGIHKKKAASPGSPRATQVADASRAADSDAPDWFRY